MRLRTYGSFKPANHKKIESAKSTFVERPQVWQIILGGKFADLRLAELICESPTFAFYRLQCQD
jgi:hypothetical protein